MFMGEHNEIDRLSVQTERVEQLAEPHRVGAAVDDHLAGAIGDVRCVALADVKKTHGQRLNGAATTATATTARRAVVHGARRALVTRTVHGRLQRPVDRAHGRVVERGILHAPCHASRSRGVVGRIHSRACGITQREPVATVGECNRRSIGIGNGHTTIRRRTRNSGEHDKTARWHIHAARNRVHGIIRRREFEVLQIDRSSAAIVDLDPFTVRVGDGVGVGHELVDHELARERRDRPRRGGRGEHTG